MNAIANMAGQLAGHQVVVRRSKLCKIREHLRDHGKCTSAQLGEAIGVAPTVARALLNYDLHRGRIVADRTVEPNTFCLPDKQPLTRGLQIAISMLESLGYTVTEP